MIWLMALMVAQAPTALPPCPNQRLEYKPWERAWYANPIIPRERLGSGPHTLVIADGNAIARMDYKTGAQCQRARNEVQRQVAPPPETGRTRYVIYGPPRIKAFCVPR